MDKRKEKSQKLILDAFMTLLKKKDFDKISMNDIAQLANINRGTIYLNFMDKYDILNHVIDHTLSEAIEKCETYKLTPENNPSILQEILYEIDKQYEALKILIVKSDLNLLKKLLSDKVLNNLTRLNNEITAQFLSSAIVGVIVWWIEQSKPCSINELAEELTVLLEPYMDNL